MVLKKWVKNKQTVGYNGARTVNDQELYFLNDLVRA